MALQWVWIIKVMGIYKIVAGILIVYGERLGSLMNMGSKILAAVFVHHEFIYKRLAYVNEHHIDLSHLVIIIGVLLVLLAKKDDSKQSIEPPKEEVKQKEQPKERPLKKKRQ